MCLYPRQMVNKKYTVTEKNGGNVPLMPITGQDNNGWNVYDTRVGSVQIPCGHCIECRKAKARGWAVRLMEEIKDWEYMYFVTFTFSPAQLGKLKKDTGLWECNALAAKALRRSLERYRKDHKKSYRHWCITEMGHEGTERIHMHGILFFNEPQTFYKTSEDHMMRWKYWQYGQVYVGDYVNTQTINYLVKYMTKLDVDHKGFEGYVLASPGIGRRYTDNIKEVYPNMYKYRPHNSRDYYRNKDGSKIKLPAYYKNKLFTEEEREKIWRDFMDKEQTTIAGNTYFDKYSWRFYENIYNKAQEINEQLGYGNDTDSWKKRKYNITPRMLNSEKNEKYLPKNLQE